MKLRIQTTIDLIERRLKKFQLKAKKNPIIKRSGLKNNLGSDLLSHPPAQAVPSAFRGLTSLFGMGRGVSPGQ